jgi:hypothetical protein
VARNQVAQFGATNRERRPRTKLNGAHQLWIRSNPHFSQTARQPRIQGLAESLRAGRPSEQPVWRPALRLSAAREKCGLEPRVVQTGQIPRPSRKNPSSITKGPLFIPEKCNIHSGEPGISAPGINANLRGLQAGVLVPCQSKNTGRTTPSPAPIPAQTARWWIPRR